MKLRNILLSTVLLSSFSFADQLDDFAQASANKSVRLTEVQKQNYISELSGVNPIKWFFWMTDSGRVFIADTRSGENADSITIWEHSLTNFTWTLVSGGSVEKIFSTISLSSDGRSITLGTSSSSSNSSSTITAGTLDAKTRAISQYVVMMGNTYDDIGGGASGVVTGVSSVTSSNSFARKAIRQDLGQFKFSSGGDWKGALGQTIMGVDPAMTMQFLRSSTGAVITEDITQVSSYIDINTGTLGPLADLASGTQPDLKKMKIKISVDMGTAPLGVSGSNVVIKPLVATIPMTTGVLPDSIVFYTTAVMTLPDGSSMNMDNVKIDIDSNNVSAMTGSFDFAKSHEGEAYTGTGSFDSSGCKGGEIFKDGSKVADIKLENGVFHVKGVNGEFDEVIKI